MKAFWKAEFASSIILPGAVLLMEQLPPSLITYASKALGKCLEPVIEPLEKGIGMVCKLDECKPDPSLTRAERAERLARFLVVFTPPAVGTFMAKLQLRRKWGIAGPDEAKWYKPWKMTGQEWMLFATDEGSHMLMMGAIQGPFAKQGDQAIRTLKSILKKSGMSDTVAHEVAAALVIHEGPNLAGGIVGSGGLALQRLLYGAPANHITP